MKRWLFVIHSGEGSKNSMITIFKQVGVSKMEQKKRSIAFMITAIYVGTSVLWMVLSDHLLGYFVSDSVALLKVTTLKGWFLLGITAVLLYTLIVKYTKLLVAAKKNLQEKNEEIMVSQHRNQILIDALPDALYRVDREGTLLDYKPGKDHKIVVDLHKEIGNNVDNFLSPNNAKIIKDGISQVLEAGEKQVFDFKFLQENLVKYHEIRIVSSGRNEVIIIARDITNRKEMEEKLQYLALYDKFTGLYNRIYFEEKLQELTDSHQVPIGIIMCDIDGLKLVNDTLGHTAGDELITNTVRIIKDCIGPEDVVARIGGDEFAILLPNKDSKQVEAVCQRIHEYVNKFPNGNHQIPMSLSLGHCVRNRPEESMHEVLKVADDNMYRGKLHSSQSVRSSIVQTLAKALEVRDFVTGGHADRLQHLIVELAQNVGLSDSRLSDLRLFGRFHDVGKVGIPDEILFKPGRLNQEEFEIMKRHCEIGYRIAQSSGDLAPIADWILKHQEWWNGQGYPLGIKADAIPLPCRILSIVDAYDAMTNDRPYRKAMFHKDAIAELERCAGTQFDPELVKAFKTIISKDIYLGVAEQSGILQEIAATNTEYHN